MATDDQQEKQTQPGRDSPESRAPGKEQNGGNGNKEEPSTAEWIAAACGLALVLGAVGFVLYKAIWGDDSPPNVQVRVEAVEPVGNGFLLKYRAYNSGGTTAEGLILTADLMRGTERVEGSQTTVDFLPSGSSRSGGFFFAHDPRQLEVRISPQGYQNP